MFKFQTSKQDISPSLHRENWHIEKIGKDGRSKSCFKSHKRGCYKCCKCSHAEGFNCNGMKHTAIDSIAICEKNSKVNVGNAMSAGNQSKFSGKLTKTLDVNNCDVEFM